MLSARTKFEKALRDYAALWKGYTDFGITDGDPPLKAALRNVLKCSQERVRRAAMRTPPENKRSCCNYTWDEGSN